MIYFTNNGDDLITSAIEFQMGPLDIF